MEHSELISELPRIEKLTAAERLRIARDRRAMQLRLFEQREKEYNAKRAKLAGSDKKKKTSTTNNPGIRKKDRNIRFVSSVMLLEAAARNDVEEVRRLLMNGVSPDSTNEDGLTALHQCCIDDSEEMMKILLDFGANVNAEDSEKWTPLHAAATCGHLHLVKYLISKGANLLSVNADGNMPYDICEDELTLDYIESEMAKRGITQELIDQTRAATEHNMLMDLKAMASKGRSLEYRDHVGATPLHIAAANGYLSVVEFLLDHHVATDVRDNDGWHPIHAAACWGHADILELLVQNGADLNAETKNHEKPYDICEDPELKNRIAAILAEQENKKLAEAAHRGTRRSGSSTAANTRTQSIRRTSIREKTMTAKKDARNEALIRLQKEHENYAESSTEGKEAAAFRAVSHHGSDEVDGEEENAPFSFAGLRKDTRGEIKLSPSERDRLQKQEANNNKNNSSSKRAAPPPPVAEMNSKNNQRPTNGVNSNTSELGRTRVLVPPQVLTSASHGSSESKIDIHVSVTINTSAVNNTGSVPSLSGVPCTLADLKRQRAHSRFLVAGSSGPASSPPAAFHNVLLLSHTETSSAVVASNTGKTNLGNERTRSENADYLVLRGDTQDVVGSSKEKKICCVIS